MKLIRFGIPIFLFALLAGCNANRSYDVEGTVTYKDQPLPAGVIWFDPDALKNKEAPQGFAYVKDGKFDTRNKGRGVKPGTYFIRIECFDGKPGNELPMGKPLPTDFGENRELPSADSKLELNATPKKK